MKGNVLDDIDEILNDRELEIEIDIPPIVDLIAVPISHEKDSGIFTTFISRRAVYAIKMVPLDYIGTASDFFMDEDRERQVTHALHALGIPREKYIVKSGDQWKIRLVSKTDITSNVISRFVDDKIASSTIVHGDVAGVDPVDHL